MKLARSWLKPSSRAESGGSSRFEALRYKDFRNWWLGYVVSISGKQMLWVVEGWLIYELSGSKLLLGAHAMAQVIPATGLALVGGAIADRVDQRRLLIAVQLLEIGFLALLAALAFTQVIQAWHVIANGFALSAVGAFEQPARQSMFPHLVERRAMSNAVGLNAMVHPGTRVLSPVIAGFVLAQVVDVSSSAMIAAGVVFTLAALGIAAYVVFLYLIHLPRVQRATSSNVLHNMAQGLQFTWKNRLFAFLITMTYFNQFFALSMHVLFPVVAKDILGLGPSGLGVMYTAQGIGSLLGAAWAGTFGAGRAQGPLLLMGSAALGAGVAFFGLSTWYPLSLLALWIVGLGGSVFSVAAQTSIQLMVSDEFRGRVMGLWGMTHTSVRPLGEMQFAAVAAFASTPVALVLGGLMVVAFVLFAAVPNRKVRSLRVTVT